MKRLEIEYRTLVFRKDSDKWHSFHAYPCQYACLDHAAELTITKPHQDFIPVMWRFDTNTYSCLTGDDPD